VEPLAPGARHGSAVVPALLAALLAAAFGAACRHGPARPDLRCDPARAACAGAHRLVILHASDAEAEILARPASGPHPAAGGIARFAGLADALRAREEAPTVLVGAGDAFMPAPALAVEVDGQNAVALANSFPGYAAAALGNHEFDLGEAFLADMVRASPFPLLTATVHPSAGPLAPLWYEVPLDQPAPWLEGLGGRIVPRGKLCAGVLRDGPAGPVCDGLAVGVIGATTETLRRIASRPTDLGVAPTFEAVRERIQAQADALAAEGVKVVLLLSHLQDVSHERELLADGLTGVDVIVAGGGDDLLADPHHRLLPGDRRDGLCDDETRCYPLLHAARDGRPVAVVAVPGQHRYLGRLAVAFDDEGVLVAVDPDSRPWPVDDPSLAEAHGAPDPAGLALEARVRSATEPLSAPVVHAEVFLNGIREDVRNRETNLGNLGADALAWAARRERPDAAFALRNGGGIRASIGSFDEQGLRRIGGPVTLLDLRTAFRFDNRIAVVTTTHRALVETLEASLRGAGEGRGHFPQVSAEVRLRYDLSRPEQLQDVGPDGAVRGVARAGGRIRELWIGGTAVVRDGRILAPEAEVTFATLDYLARGGDGWFPGSAAGLRVAILDATEVAAALGYLEHLAATGRWNGGAGYPDPDPADVDTFTRLIPASE
jgi:5'-nucleotidase/UDP-sugar diphosphatase